MRRALAVGLSCVLAAMTVLPSGETRPAYPPKPTVTVEYRVSDVAWPLQPFLDDTHRVVAEFFAGYDIVVQRGIYQPRPGHVRVDIIGDIEYDRILADDIALDSTTQKSRGYARYGKDRALLRASSVYSEINSCPGSVVADISEVAAHEIGHLLGLGHLETKELNSTTYNLMDDDALQLRPHLCAGAIDAVRGDDLNVSLTLEQVAVIRDAAQGGLVWEALNTLPNFETYRALRQRFFLLMQK